MCGQCDDPGLWVQVQEVVSGPFLADATVTAGGTTCARFVERTDGMYRCDLPAGTYDITVTAPGHVSKTTSATLAEPSPGACCTCGGPYLLVEVKLDLAP